MRVRLDPDGARPVLRAMPPDARKKMRAALRKLADDPSGRSARLDVKRLRTPGEPSAFRLRMGEWRAVWLLRKRSLDVIRIFHRSEGYGWLDRRYR
jgi:mRNA-degrading endonuclease RelE of RelBE toxin-antitoxin system